MELQEILNLLVSGNTVLSVGILALAFWFVRAFQLETLAQRWKALFDVLAYRVAILVEQADRIRDEIEAEYGELAEKRGQDARLLWVIDQVEAWVKKTFKLDVDLNLVVDMVEDYLEGRKLDNKVQK